MSTDEKEPLTPKMSTDGKDKIQQSESHSEEDDEDDEEEQKSSPFPTTTHDHREDVDDAYDDEHDVDNSSTRGSKKNNGYVVVDVTSDTQDTQETIDILDRTDTNHTMPVPSSFDVDVDDREQKTAPSTTNNRLEHERVRSNSSNPRSCATTFAMNKPKARILCTWVPTDTSNTELTVIAGDMVTVVQCESLDGHNSVHMNDDSVVMRSMHWTQVQQRSGKLGVVPSNILAYDENMVNTLWLQVRIQHSYMSKSKEELTVLSGERVQIYGCVNDDGMVRARRQNNGNGNSNDDDDAGCIPYNFVQIPSAANMNMNMVAVTASASNASLQATQPASFLLRAGSMSTDQASNATASEHAYDGQRTGTAGTDLPYRTSVSRSSNHAIQTIFAHATIAELTMDELTESEQALSPRDPRATHRKTGSRIATRIKRISTAITSAVDKLQLSSYSHAHSKTSDMLPNVHHSHTHSQATLGTPTGATVRAKSLTSGAANPTAESFVMTAGTGGDTLKFAAGCSLQDSSENAFTAPASHSHFQWNAPLHWTRMFVLKAFPGTQSDIDQVYELYVLDRLSRDRQESLLSYEEGDADAENDADVNGFNAAIPNKQKKSIHDVLAITTSDSIEVCGDASPEGWILARFCEDTARKGYVPVACLTLANAVATTANNDTYNNNNHNQNAPSNMTLAMQQHLHATQQQQQQTERVSISVTNPHTTQHDTTNHNKGEDLNLEPQETDAHGGHTTNDHSNTMKSSNLPQQHLPIHWPFSSYPISKRSQKGKIMETVVLMTLLIIYALPILIEEPSPDGAPKNYNLWFINLFGAFLPWLVISVLRTMELWTSFVSKQSHPNNRLYAILVFYIVIVIYFVGLFAIVIEALIQSQWIRQNSVLLFFATLVQIIVFAFCVLAIGLAVLFIFCWTYCCRVSRNRWETRIEFLCCICCSKNGDIPTKRYPRLQT